MKKMNKTALNASYVRLHTFQLSYYFTFSFLNVNQPPKLTLCFKIMTLRWVRIHSIESKFYNMSDIQRILS